MEGHILPNNSSEENLSKVSSWKCKQAAPVHQRGGTLNNLAVCHTFKLTARKCSDANSTLEPDCLLGDSRPSKELSMKYEILAHNQQYSDRQS